MADIVTMAKDELKARGKADAAALAARAVSGEAGAQELLDNQEKIPTWRARDFTQVPVGTPYQWNGMIYKLVQQHDATGNSGWTPDAVPALWAAVSQPGETGTQDDPITAARRMEYQYGKYYSPYSAVKMNTFKIGKLFFVRHLFSSSLTEPRGIWYGRRHTPDKA